MAVGGWLLDKSAAARSADQRIGAQLAELAGSLYLCPVGQLEQLFSARSAEDYDALEADLRDTFGVAAAPSDVFEKALDLQRDLAHHHGMWHRTPIPDLLIACIALHHGLGVVHVDRDFEWIAEGTPARRPPACSIGLARPATTRPNGKHPPGGASPSRDLHNPNCCPLRKRDAALRIGSTSAPIDRDDRGRCWETWKRKACFVQWYA